MAMIWGQDTNLLSSQWSSANGHIMWSENKFSSSLMRPGHDLPENKLSVLCSLPERLWFVVIKPSKICMLRKNRMICIIYRMIAYSYCRFWPPGTSFSGENVAGILLDSHRPKSRWDHSHQDCGGIPPRSWSLFTRERLRREKYSK